MQRLGLARAFVHPYRVLILDDATSSLDTVTERQVSAVLSSGGPSGGRSQTRLIIAHRAATAARADLVAWLDRGALRSLRPHGELWRDPDYRALFGVEAVPAEPLRPGEAPCEAHGVPTNALGVPA
jgi:ATP-binding cassette, subfamily B, bacterial